MSMKAFVTGGSGLLGRYIVKRLAEDRNFIVYPVVSEGRVSFSEGLYRYLGNVRIITTVDFLDDSFLAEALPGSIVIHAAFTRKNDGEEIVKSLQYTYKVFNACRKFSAGTVLNISSRSVYKDPETDCLNSEDSALCANGLISAAKYASELLLHSFFSGSTKLYGLGGGYSNLRVSSVNELKTDNNMIRPLNVFVDCVMTGQNIKVYGGNQVMSFIDPRDAAEAVYLICTSGSKNLKDTYNIGTGCTYTIMELAKKVIQTGVKLGYPKVDIDVISKDDNQRAGLDITRLREDFGFEPRITIDDMIRSLFEMKRGIL